MNIIFLDIDGPLLPGRQWFTAENMALLAEVKGSTRSICEDFELKKRVKFDPVGVFLFNQWARRSKAQIVLSTNWTHHTTFDQLIEIFTLNGLELEFHKGPYTPKKMNSTRDSEIFAWLEAHRGEVDNYLIVDDDYHLDPERLDFDGGPFATMAEHVLMVDEERGLTSKDYVHGMMMLGLTADVIKLF